MFSKDTKEFDRISRYILYTIGNFKNCAVFRTLITYNFFFIFNNKKKKIIGYQSPKYRLIFKIPFNI